MVTSDTYSRPLLLGSENFFYWYEKSPYMRQLNLLLGQLCDEGLIDGLEIVVPFHEFHEWIEALHSDRFALPGKLSFLSHEVRKSLFTHQMSTVHLQPLNQFPVELDSWLGKSLKVVSELTGINDFTTHPDAHLAKRCGTIVEQMAVESFLSIENMDIRKASFQTLPELLALSEQFPQLKFTFDTAHWIERNRNLDDPELLKFIEAHQDKISKIHFSVPGSTSPDYSCMSNIETGHYLCADSGYSVPHAFHDSLNGRVPWVIEGLVPPGNERLLRKELQMLCARPEKKKSREASVFNF